jgi:hypothetical protein
MPVEQTQLLRPVRGIVGGVQIGRDPPCPAMPPPMPLND